MSEKVLFLGSPCPNHGDDTFFYGLCESFGDENVHQFPIEAKFNSTYSYDPYNFWTVKGTKTDCQSPYVYCSHHDWVREINKPNSEIKHLFCVAEPTLNNWMFGRYPSIYRLINLLQEIKSKDLCVTFIQDSGDFKWLGTKQFIDFFSKPKIPTFEIDGDPKYRTFPSVLDRIDIWLKNDYIESMNPLPNKIYPFYVSAPHQKLLDAVGGRMKPFEEKEIDVLYLVGHSHQDRVKYYNILKNGLKIGNNVIHCGTSLTSSLKEYFEMLNNSKIVISVRGTEPQNCRNVEGPFYGAALFSQKLDYQIPNPYIGGESCIYFDETNLLDQLHYFIKNQDKLRILAKKSQQHCLENHTSIARVNQYKKLANIKKNGKEI